MSAWLLWVAAFVISALAGYASWLWWQVWQQSRNRRQAEARGPQVTSFDPARYRQNREAIFQLICALENDALTLTEACMRISALASQIGELPRLQQDYQAIIQLAIATAHIPILDAWQALSKEQKRAFDKERSELEQRFEQEIMLLMPELKALFSEQTVH